MRLWSPRFWKGHQRLLHYSSRPIEGPITLPTNAGIYKPRAFWVSVEGQYDWRWWCEDEEFCLENLTCVHEVTFKPSARVLHLASAHGLKMFHYQWSEPIFFGTKVPDWDALALRYDGLIIAPYQWSERLGECSWYYPWDCASGCIWNLDAIDSVTLVEDHREEKDA